MKIDPKLGQEVPLPEQQPDFGDGWIDVSFRIGNNGAIAFQGVVTDNLGQRQTGPAETLAAIARVLAMVTQVQADAEKPKVPQLMIARGPIQG